MKSRHLLALLPALALGWAAPAHAADPVNAVESTVADAKGDAAKVAMRELDDEIDRVDAMIDNAPTQAEKDAAKARMEVLKERRNELRKTYVRSRYDELKADVRREANKFGAWSRRTFTRDPADKAADDVKDAAHDAKRDARRAGDRAAAYAGSTAAALDLKAYKTRATDTDRDVTKAALKALDQKIEMLDDQVDRMPRGADRDVAKRRVKALEDRKDELKHDFNKARFDELVDDVEREADQLAR